jgi:tetratricopeptide (TPR) repeat protein
LSSPTGTKTVVTKLTLVYIGATYLTAGMKMAQGEVELKPGDVFAGYRIVQRLGPGVMGIVYLARDTLRVRRVALKILQPELAADSEYVELFEEQAAAAMEVRHKNIASFFAAGKEEGLLYTACEFIRGDTLAARIERQGRLEVPVILSLLLTIGRALSYLHSRGIVHGGVNPGNIRFTAMGEVKLVDVGLAKKLVLRPERSKVKTTVTPVYLAPELVKKTIRVDARADIYSLGITAYQALTGTVPFAGSTPHETVLRIMNEPLAPRGMKGVPPDLADLISRMAAKRPQDRPATMIEMLAEMEKMAARLAPAAVGAGPTPAARVAMTRRSARGRQKVLFYILVAAVVAVVFFAFFLPGKPGAQTQGEQLHSLEQQAVQALKEAQTHEADHPEDTAESLRLYRGVVHGFPGTGAAEKAQAAVLRLAFILTTGKVAALTRRNRHYDAALAYGEFEKHYAGTPQASEAARRKALMLSQLDDRFRSDLLEAATLAQKGELERALALLARVEEYGSPGHREKARRGAEDIRHRAGVLTLKGTYAGAWQAAEPMLAISSRQIANHEYETADASCDSFLASPLPEGVQQIIQWEKEDLVRLRKVQENFAAALGDAAGRGSRTSFTLADGTVVSGLVVKEPDGYYLHLAQDRKWRIRAADIASGEVLKLAGMDVDDMDAVLTAMLYELHHGSAEKARTLLDGLTPRLDRETGTRYQNKLEIVSALLRGGIARARSPLDPRDIRRAARIVEAARESMKRKDWNQAYQLLKQAVALNPAEPEVPGMLAGAAARKGLTSEAVQYCRKALALNPNNAILWNELGKLYLGKDELGLALVAFRQSARINPADAVAVQGRVEALLKLGQEEEARRVQEEWEKARRR